MRKISRTSGFTYIEVMIAATLASILIAPVFMSLYQTTQKILYAQNSYVGSIHAENLLIDGTVILDSVGMASGIFDITTLIPDFNTRYDTSTFDYALIFYMGTDPESAIVYTDNPDSLHIPTGLYTENLESFFEDSTYLGESFVAYDGSTVRVTGGTGSTTIDVPLTLPPMSGEKAVLPIVNAEDNTANVNIYSNRSVDARIIEGSVLIRYFGSGERQRYIMKAIVFDSRGLVVKSVFKFSP